MSAARTSVVVLAGPNGAGKSTVASALLHGALAVNEFVNADVIASGLSAFNPDSAAITAGRVMVTRLRELAAQRASFAFETRPPNPGSELPVWHLTRPRSTMRRHGNE